MTVSVVKAQAFYPPSDLRLSVVRSIDLHEAELWQIADTHVVPARGLPVLASADFLVSHVPAQQLHLDCDNEFERHASIVGWPTGKSAVDVATMKSLAQELAARSALRRRQN